MMPLTPSSTTTEAPSGLVCNWQTKCHSLFLTVEFTFTHTPGEAVFYQITSFLYLRNNIYIATACEKRVTLLSNFIAVAFFSGPMIAMDFFYEGRLSIR